MARLKHSRASDPETCEHRGWRSPRLPVALLVGALLAALAHGSSFAAQAGSAALSAQPAPCCVKSLPS